MMCIIEKDLLGQRRRWFEILVGDPESNEAPKKLIDLDRRRWEHAKTCKICNSGA